MIGLKHGFKGRRFRAGLTVLLVLAALLGLTASAWAASVSLSATQTAQNGVNNAPAAAGGAVTVYYYGNAPTATDNVTIGITVDGVFDTSDTQVDFTATDWSISPVSTSATSGVFAGQDVTLVYTGSSPLSAGTVALNAEGATSNQTATLNLTVALGKVTPTITTGQAVSFTVGATGAQTVRMSPNVTGAGLKATQLEVQSKDVTIPGPNADRLWSDDPSLTFSSLSDSDGINITPAGTGAATAHAAAPFALQLKNFSLDFSGTEVKIAGVGSTTAVSDDFTVAVLPATGALTVNPAAASFNTGTWSGTTFTTVSVPSTVTLASFDVTSASYNGATMSASDLSTFRSRFNFTTPASASATNSGTLSGTGTTVPASGVYVMTLTGRSTTNVAYTGTFTLTVGGAALRLNPSSHTFTTGGTWAGTALVTSADFSTGTMTSWRLSAATKDGATIADVSTIASYFTLSTPASGVARLTANGTNPPAVGVYVLTFTGTGTAGSASANFTLRVQAPSTTPTVSASPTSLTFPYGSTTAQTLTLTTTNSSAKPTVSADSAILKLGTVTDTTTAGRYTVSVAPADGYAYPTAGTETGITVSLTGADSRRVSVTMGGSGGSSTWTSPTTAQATVVLNATGILASNQSLLNTSNVSRTLPTSNTVYDRLINRYALAGYMAFSQTVPNGGALVNWFNNSVILTLNPVGVGGVTLAQNLYSPTSDADFRRNYDVVKVFDGNHAISLLDVVASDFFAYDIATRTVRANGVFVVVDSVAPTVAPTGFRLHRTSTGYGYGVAYASNIGGTRYLIVYDGLGNGSAVDPIALVQREGSSSGGCGAGFGAMALLLGVAAVPVLRRRG